MRTRALNSFECVRAEGGLLTPDILGKIAALDQTLPGLRPVDYGTNLPLREATASAWNRVLGEWAAFRGKAEAPVSYTGPLTGETRSRWLFPLFEVLGFGKLTPGLGLTLGEKAYPISHHWERTPIHLVGSGVDLDRRTAGVAGAAKSSPYSLVQEYLNNAGERQWGIVSNGRVLRLLRNSHRVARQQLIEFDLERMMEGQSYDDFVVLWLVCHRSRFESHGSDPCWLEQWSDAVAETGVRALNTLRDGVMDSITALGSGFLAHPANGALKERLRSGELTTLDFYQQVLRLVYRLIFLCAAEDRDVLFTDHAETTRTARERYTAYYSAQRLRRLASRTRGDGHGDLYAQLRQIFTWLGSDDGFAPLALPALDSFLFAQAGRSATPDLDVASFANSALLAALRRLCLIESDGQLRPVSFKDLGAEELGSVYETLLEMHPDVNADAATFNLGTASGNERKSTGSYYTPTSLITSLLDTALVPVIQATLDAARGEHSEEKAARLLTLRIVDPACGSGHFLIAAAHRLAREVAKARTGESEPPVEATRAALREVIAHCVYGVDVNPMAVELCKVNLWLEALEPGKPLGFLDHHVKCGNAVIGAPMEVNEPQCALIVSGDAFTPATDEEKIYAKSLKNRLKEQAAGQLYLAETADNLFNAKEYASQVGLVNMRTQETPAAVHEVEAEVKQVDERFAHLRLLADAWCAAFFWPLDSEHMEEAPLPITLRALRDRPQRVSQQFKAEVRHIASEHKFFHWHLEFPDVMTQHGGFDVVLGNPPWEQIELEPQEFFAVSRPDIANARNAHARDQLIAEGARERDVRVLAYFDLKRHLDAERSFLRNSGRFPFGSRGRINLYAVFTENNWNLLRTHGHTGMIVPSGVATDSFTQELFRNLVDSNSLVSLYDFENREGLFPEVDSRFKFSLLTLTRGAGPGRVAKIVCFSKHVAELDDPDKMIRLAPADFAIFNPNTRTMPIFRSKRDEQLTRKMYQAAPILINESDQKEGNPWGARLQLMFMMNSDSHLFRTQAQLVGAGYTLRADRTFVAADQPEYLPLYEGKMFHQYDHRFATFEGEKEDKTRDASEAEHADPSWEPLPRYWVPRAEVDKALGEWSHDWMMVYRRIARATDERTFVTCISPGAGAGDPCPVIISACPASGQIQLGANLNSLAFDYLVRQKVGAIHVDFFLVKQLPVLPPEVYARPLGETTVGAWVTRRALELSYTSEALRSLARDLGYDGPPFAWDEARRAHLRGELDGLYARLYGLSRDELEYITTTFPVLRKNEERAYGEFRTARLALAGYDALAGEVTELIE